MKVVFHEDFYQVYTSDPAAAAGRMEAAVNTLEPRVTFVDAAPAGVSDISAVHTKAHIEHVRQMGLYHIGSLAAGGAIQCAMIGLEEPSFGLIRPPGHHASRDSSWGFCYFNNMAVALAALKRQGKIQTACVLDIDLHFGDGTVNILGDEDDVIVWNVSASEREAYMDEVNRVMAECQTNLIGVSAGFDNHEEDWGGLLRTNDYYDIGRAVRSTALRCGGGCFAILEGGYNHQVLGQNVLALIEGLSWT
jgi:acetoin utilization deacetylase AcuC-like enzyme